MIGVPTHVWPWGVIVEPGMIPLTIPEIKRMSLLDEGDGFDVMPSFSSRRI